MIFLVKCYSLLFFYYYNNRKSDFLLDTSKKLLQNILQIFWIRSVIIKKLILQSSKKKLPKHMVVPVLCVLLKKPSCKGPSAISVFMDDTGNFHYYQLYLRQILLFMKILIKLKYFRWNKWENRCRSCCYI